MVRTPQRFSATREARLAPSIQFQLLRTPSFSPPPPQTPGVGSKKEKEREEWVREEERVLEQSEAAPSALGHGRAKCRCRSGPLVTPEQPGGQQVRVAVCASTYVGGLFLRQFQLFLGIFESLGVFVQFIFGALEFLL